MASKTIRLSIPHRLTADEAARKLRGGIDDLLGRFGGQAQAQVHQQWPTPHHLDFHMDAMGQSVSGKVDVDAQDVHLEVDLPWGLGLFAEKIKSQIQQEGRRLLEKK